jgi:hypothetical protein
MPALRALEKNPPRDWNHSAQRCKERAMAGRSNPFRIRFDWGLWLSSKDAIRQDFLVETMDLLRFCANRIGYRGYFIPVYIFIILGRFHL